MAVSARLRFEVFKRDGFACRYCGGRSPDVVLEVDHVIPRATGGGDDEMNLVTACFACNRGKSDIPLGEVMTGDDPHDKAILILERERQLEEYNAVLEAERERRHDDCWDLVRYWKSEQGITDERELTTLHRRDHAWLTGALKYCPREVIRSFMELALSRGYTKNLSWVGACVRNWRAEKGYDPQVKEVVGGGD